MNDHLQDKISLLLKTEKTLLRLQMRKKLRQSLLVIVALIFLFIALASLNVSLYFYFETLTSPLYSALILTGINTALALILLVIALNLSLGEDEKSVYEIRAFARQQLQYEVDDIRGNIFSFKRVLQILSLFKKARS